MPLTVIFSIIVLFSCMIYAHPTFQPSDPSSIDPRGVVISKHNDYFAGNDDQDGWRVRYITVDIPVPMDVARSRIGEFYHKLKNLVPGNTESTLVVESDRTLHLGSEGGLWLNVRSQYTTIHQETITQVLNVLIDGVESGWSPMFECESVALLVFTDDFPCHTNPSFCRWTSPDGDEVIYISLTHGKKGEIPDPVGR